MLLLPGAICFAVVTTMQRRFGIVVLGLMCKQLLHVAANSANPTVAFSAHRLHDTTLSKGQPIIFESVETNIGQGYDKTHGRFTCQIDGVYYFAVNILSHINHLLQAHLVVDGVPVAGLYTIGAPGKDDQSTASAAVFCASGQQVWVKSLDNYLINGESVGYTQFTGFLLNAVEPGVNIAFSVYKAHDEQVVPGQVLQFDGITTNIGQAYDNGTGIFMCPASGMYFFTVNILSLNDNWFKGYIRLDDKPIAGVYAVGASSSVHDHSTASVVVHCDEGQEVSITSQGKFHVNGEPVGFTQFTGFLLARDGDPNLSSAVSVPTIAFSAHRQHDYTVPDQAAVLFDIVETNLGQSYNGQTGKFTCPVDGTYYFTVNILSHLNHWFIGYIVLEDRPIAGVYAVGAASGSDDQSSVSVVVHCVTGQQIWLKSTRNQPINGESVGYTQFSGFLVTQDSPVSIIG